MNGEYDAFKERNPLEFDEKEFLRTELNHKQVALSNCREAHVAAQVEVTELREQVRMLSEAVLAERDQFRAKRIEMQNRISHLERTLQSVLDRGMPK